MRVDSLQISHSSRAMFASCPRKLEFRKFYNHSRREESSATLTGSALHKAYQDFLVHKDRERAIFILMMEMPTAYDERPLQPRSIEACYSTLLAMMDFQQYNKFEVAVIDGKPAIEVPFRLRIANFSLEDDRHVPVEYIGYIDVVLFDPKHERFISTDIKTTTRGLSDFTPAYKFDDQQLPYAFVIESALGQPVDQLDVQYMNCVISLDNPQITNLPFVKSRADIEDWARGLALDLQMLKLYYNNNWFPRRVSGCTAYNRTCNAFDFCHSRDSAMIEHMLSFETAQEQRQFDPWIDIELTLETGK